MPVPPMSFPEMAPNSPAGMGYDAVNALDKGDVVAWNAFQNSPQFQAGMQWVNDSQTLGQAFQAAMASKDPSVMWAFANSPVGQRFLSLLPPSVQQAYQQYAQQGQEAFEQAVRGAFNPLRGMGSESTWEQLGAWFGALNQIGWFTSLAGWIADVFGGGPAWADVIGPNTQIFQRFKQQLLQGGIGLADVNKGDFQGDPSDAAQAPTTFLRQMRVTIAPLARPIPQSALLTIFGPISQTRQFGSNNFSGNLMIGSFYDVYMSDGTISRRGAVPQGWAPP